MEETRGQETRPYHHGDLRRALIGAARRLLEREGAAALSLRAVAREAGVSPAAPYHHFRDKAELLEAVADEGWLMLSQSLADAAAEAPPQESQILVLLAYVCFARERPALYRVMYDSAREQTDLVKAARSGDNTAFNQVRNTLAAQGAYPTQIEVELSMTAGWCAAHGLAEMAGFKQFEPLKTALGGEVPFLTAVLRRMGLYRLPAAE
jgi:AcrR family transcriptional regulator